MFIKGETTEMKHEKDDTFKSSPENLNLKRKIENIHGGVIREEDLNYRRLVSSSGSCSGSDREDLLNKMNEPLFADFFVKKRKLESSDGRSTSNSSTCSSNDSSDENSPWENSPEDGGEKTSVSYNSRDVDDSHNKKHQLHKRYIFKHSLDYLSSKAFCNDKSMISVDTSKKLHNVHTSFKKITTYDIKKNHTESSNGSSPSNFNERSYPGISRHLDCFSNSSPSCSYSSSSSYSPSCTYSSSPQPFYKTLICPSTSTDNFKRENSTASESLTSSLSAAPLEVIPKQLVNAGERKSHSIGSFPLTESGYFSNQQFDHQESSQSSVSNSDCNKSQTHSSSKYINDKEVDNTLSGGFENKRIDMYLNAPDGFTKCEPFSENYKTDTSQRLMYQSIQTGQPQQNISTNDENDLLRLQDSSYDMAWYGYTTFEPETMQFTQVNQNVNSQESLDVMPSNGSIKNNENMIANTHGGMEYNASGIHNFSSAFQVDEKNKWFQTQQRNNPNGFSNQGAHHEIVLQQGNQGTGQARWPITTNMNLDQSTVRSDARHERVGCNIVQVTNQHQVWHQQHDLVRNAENSQSNSSFPLQSQGLYPNTNLNLSTPPGKNNFLQEKARKKANNDFKRDQTQMNANSLKKSGVKEPKSQVACIAMAIMSQPDCKMTLFEIYQYIEQNHQQYLRRHDWRNGVRHTLSHNVCFIKKEKARHHPRKGHYWSIHPACIKSFSEGIFCLRHSKRVVMEYKNPCLQSSSPQQIVTMDTTESSQHVE